MNHGPTDGREFVRAFLAHYHRRQDRTVILFPPALTFAAVAAALGDRTDILLGVQNIHAEDKGAFTGENSAAMARDAGARFVLAGHSERRHVFGESDELIGRKCAAAARAGLTPILCVGEQLEERERDEARDVVLRQLRAGVEHLTPAQIGAMAVAYEPVWAIGTGRNATPDDAGAMHRVLREALHDIVAERAASVPLLYGGSVSRGNVAALLAASDVDGVLVGGASLDAEGWSSIVST